MKKVTSISFLFGAGSEGLGNFKIPLGFDYLKKSMFCNDYNPAVLNGLQAYFTKSNYYDSYKYRKDTFSQIKPLFKNFLLNKSESDVSFYNKHRDILLRILSNASLREIASSHDISNADRYTIPNESEKEEIDKIELEFSKIIKDEISTKEKMSYAINKDLFSQDGRGRLIIDFNVGWGGMMDAQFHSIINPVKYGIVRFSKVFNYYWASYFTIIDALVAYLLKTNNTTYIDKFLDQNTKKNKKPNYLKIISNIQDFTEALYRTENISKDGEPTTYYQLIRQKLFERKDLSCPGVATTNYFKFAETVFSKNVVYLNGKLNLFEFPEDLEVHDLLDYENVIDNDRLFFPFIFGQSLVKPLVHRHQINEYHKFEKLLEKTDILVVLGFNLNEDDNHINSYLHDFIMSGKKIIVVQKTGSTQDAHLKIKCKPHQIDYCEKDYGNNLAVVDAIFDKITKMSE